MALGFIFILNFPVTEADIRFFYVVQGKRCPKMVSRRVKSGMCLAHRGVDAKQGFLNSSLFLNSEVSYLKNLCQPFFLMKL